MRAGLSSIQQTLTPEVATVLGQSIAEARRRNHGQTTPLHVAATLLASPSGCLRQACIRSHPNSSHPLQCRALELCFSVALERLTTAQNAPEMEPPISNALMVALKRAQAHQRRGCPEQQQQPLLAVRVELEQLMISILDDPSVSRVMREASFSSPAVKASIEQTLNKNSSNNPIHHHHHMSYGGIAQLTHNLVQLAPNPASSTHTSIQLAANPVHSTPPSPLGNRNLYLNPRLQQQGAFTGQRGEEMKKVLEIMGQVKKKNPVLVGDSEPDAVVKEVLRKIQSKDLEIDDVLKNVEIVSMDKGVLSNKNQIPAKIKELGFLVESKIGSGIGVILDLGDMKWLVEQPVGFGGLQPQQQVISEIGRAAVVEMAGLLARFGGGGGNEKNNRTNGSKLWLIGTATCETYLRCQVYHSEMENDWDLQAVPIASRLPLPGMFPRMLSNPVESLTPLKTVPTHILTLTQPVSENSGTGLQSAFCPKCSENYEKELTKLSDIEKTFSTTKQDASKPSLPRWLQTAKLKTAHQSQGNEGVLSKHKTQELQKKWRDICLNLHSNFHQNSRPTRRSPPALSMPSLYNPNLLSRPPFQPRLQTTSKPLQLSMNPLTSSPNLLTTKPLGEALQLNMNPLTSPPAEVGTPPGSPVGTELVLGTKGTLGKPQAKDLLSCISSEILNTKLLEKFANALDADTYKKLLKGLMEKAWWQAEAASSVASAITRCSLGNGKHRGGGARGDVWLLFSGPDRAGKKKMASALADQICGSHLIIVCVGVRRDDEEMDTGFRGKTAIDRIADAVRRNPFSVIMLEDIDEADLLVRGSIKRAIERGRLTDTHGREVGLGSAVFILTGDWSTDGHSVDEKKLASVASRNWHLGLIVREKNAKRRAHWLLDGDGPNRLSETRKGRGSSLSLDLNLAVDNKGSHNDSSDLTADHEEELGLVSGHFAITSLPHDLVNNVDDSIVFKPVDSAFVLQEIKKTIAVKFSMVVDGNLAIEVDDDVLEKIMGGLWHDTTSLEQWVENVLEPSFDQLKPLLPACDKSGLVVRLVVESNGVSRGKSSLQGNGDCWLPSSILVWGYN